MSDDAPGENSRGTGHSFGYRKQRDSMLYFLTGSTTLDRGNQKVLDDIAKTALINPARTSELKVTPTMSATRCGNTALSPVRAKLGHRILRSGCAI